MTGPTLQSAVEELYSSPTAEFTARRKALSVAARSDGDRVLAAEIGALRKPTLSADTLNRLVRSAPEAMRELLDLGEALRAAEKALDAAILRELSATRRSLVNDLAELAFDITEQKAPSGSTRDEVVATLNAALADEEVAARLMSGALVTQARWDGFGSASLPELAAGMSIPLPRARAKPTGVAKPEPAKPEPVQSGEAEPVPGGESPDRKTPDLKAPDRKTTQDLATKQATAAATLAAERAAARATATATATAAALAKTAATAAADQRRREKERLAALASARTEADDAERAAKEAAQTVADIDRRISELGLQLAHQRQLLATAQVEARAAQTRRRAARQALTRSGGPATD